MVNINFTKYLKKNKQIIIIYFLIFHPLLDDEEGFRFHMFKHEHSGPLKCIQCGYLTYNRRKFISHVESLGDVHDNKCTQCNEVMNTFDEHILHLHQVSIF